MKLKSGETILIQGGAGGVAGFAIQLAKHLGARVITTASAANLSYLRDLGADQVIDYNTTDFTKVVSNCDAVFDTVGGDVAARSFAVLKPGGRAAFIASGAKAPTPERSDVTALRPLSAATGRISIASPRSIRPASSARPRSRSTIVRSCRSHAAERGASRQRQAGVQGAVRGAASKGAPANVRERIRLRFLPEMGPMGPRGLRGRFKAAAQTRSKTFTWGRCHA